MRKRLVPRVVLTLLITLGFGGWMWLGRPPTGGSDQAAQTARIGGAFSLVDTRGGRVTDVSLKGKYSLVFFGFTHCPDVCPTALLSMTNALHMLEAGELQKLTPVFITVDPERDTTQAMAGYLANFHPAILGLTGSDAEIRAAQDAYKVYAGKQPAGGNGGDYAMNHSGYFYLMGADGRYLTHFASAIRDEDLARALKKYLNTD